jgi:hypothetical protein
MPTYNPRFETMNLERNHKMRLLLAPTRCVPTLPNKPLAPKSTKSPNGWVTGNTILCIRADHCRCAAATAVSLMFDRRYSHEASTV